MSGVISPTDTSLPDAVWQDLGLQSRLLFDGVDVQARADVPRDVAVERPHPRVIRLVLQHDIAGVGRGTGLHDLHVAALGVLLVDDRAVPGSDALGEDVEVVAVEVHRVVLCKFVFDDDAHGAVVSEVVDVPFGIGGIRDVALVGEDENGMALKGMMSATLELHVSQRLTRSCLGKTRCSCRKESFQFR